MQVALAYEQGYLTTKDANHVQRWALAYRVAQESKAVRDKENALSKRFENLSKDILWVMNPALFSEIKKAEDNPFESDELMDESDLDTIEAMLEKMNKGETISAEQLSLTDWR